jgi:hypothetical protein
MVKGNLYSLMVLAMMGNGVSARDTELGLRIQLKELSSKELGRKTNLMDESKLNQVMARYSKVIALMGKSLEKEGLF